MVKNHITINLQKEIIREFPFKTFIYKHNYLFATNKKSCSNDFSCTKKRYCKQILHTVAFFRYKFDLVATNDYFVK